MMKPEKHSAAGVLVGLMLGVIFSVGGLTLINRTRPAAMEIIPPEPTPSPVSSPTPGPIRVYVSGAVVAPAVYQLPPGSIVEEAIQAAGGFLEDADTAAINLAQPLSDGVQVYVPLQGESSSHPAGSIATPVPPGDVTGPATPGGLVNINTASLEELDTLPGIGPATAQKIIDHREANGPFPSIEAIMDVSGIGPAKFNDMRDLITVGGD